MLAVRCLLSFAALAVFIVPAFGAVLDDIGYNRLKLEQGANLPLGDGVPVAMSEAGNNDFYPNVNHADFTGKTFEKLSGTAGITQHATTVGRYFHGDTLSPVPATDHISLYSADDWLHEFLNAAEPNLPAFSQARVANHSWIDDSLDKLNILHRTDWLVETDDFLQVAGVNNNTSGTEPPRDIFAGAFNVVAVGLTNGLHSTGTQSNLNPPYRLGRTRPHIVAPMSVTSFAAPLVGGTAALLIDYAKTNPAISNGSVTSSVGRNNFTLRRGETSEVIRAVLMAGADRSAVFGIRPYVLSTANGLDSQFGAGELDVYNSFHILAGGEQDPREAGNLTDVSFYGWDYEPAFASNTTKTYRFTVEHAPRTFAASLVWNLDIDLTLTSGQYQDLAVELRDLNLRLRNADTGVNLLSSIANNDTNENLFLQTLLPGRYELVVSAIGSPFVTEYGLAWRFAPTATPIFGDIDLDGAVSLRDLGIMAQNYGQMNRGVWTDGDLDANGRVDRRDLALFAQNYGTRPIPIASSPQAIPEPSAGIVALCGLSLAFAWRKRIRSRAL